MMRKVLVIEDDESLQESYKVALSHAGFKVLIAGDGTAGLKSAEKDTPDLIILDQILPGMIGMEVLEQLKKNPGTTQIPVIVSSNIDSPESRLDFSMDGAVSFISKSDTSMHEIIEQIKSLLKN